MKIFAHRGASKEAPDNSPESARKAIAIGVDAIEIDCSIREDDTPVAAHDAPLPDSPTLKEILEILKPSGVGVILDFKAPPQTIVELALKILPPERILASSFHFRHLLTLKKKFPKLKRGLILAPNVFRLVPPAIFAKLLGVVSIHPCLKDLKESQVKKWQARGFKVYTWTVNSEADFKRCRELGVDGVFTDDPRKARTVLKNG